MDVHCKIMRFTVTLTKNKGYQASFTVTLKKNNEVQGQRFAVTLKKKKGHQFSFTVAAKKHNTGVAGRRFTLKRITGTFSTILSHKNI